MILNSRPSSYVSTEDIEEPLTPSHLMTGGRVLSLPDVVHYRRPPEDSDFQVDVSHETKSENEAPRDQAYKSLFQIMPIIESTNGCLCRAARL